MLKCSAVNAAQKRGTVSVLHLTFVSGQSSTLMNAGELSYFFFFTIVAFTDV